MYSLAIVGAAALALLGRGVTAQHDMTSNLTSLEGTWSSGSGAVMTGSGFANPVNYSFTYPKTSGIAMSFTNDGYWEEAQYRFVSNGSKPHCVKAVVFWQHGTYTFEANGSLTMQPIAADGRIQVQDPCAPQTSVMTYYYQPSLYQTWNIYNDIHHNTYNLQLQSFDGSLFPRLYLVARPPNMLPTVQLTTNATTEATSAVNQANSQTTSARLRHKRSGVAHKIRGAWEDWNTYWS